FGDLGGPLDGGFARRKFQDTEAAVELLDLRVGLVRDGAVGGDHQRRDVLVDTTAEHIDTGILRLAYARVCRFADDSHVFVGDVHRRSGKEIRYFVILRSSGCELRNGCEAQRHAQRRREAPAAEACCSAADHAGFVSRATRSRSVSGIEKLSFSKPITCPVESFMRTTSSPVSSQTCSCRRSLNQTVSVRPSRS